MNEQLQGKLVEILASIQEASRAAGDFAMEQLPDIAQSYVLYGRVTASVYFLVALLVTAVSLYIVVRKGFLGGKVDRFGLWSESRIAAATFGAVSLFISVFALAETFFRFALVWLAPKVWLLKELAALVR